MNLHGTVRAAIPSVNPDIPISYIASTGQTTSTAGKRTPGYAAPVALRGQVQATTGQDLKKYNFLQGQGVFRVVYLFGNKQAIVKINQQGGDLLKFPQSQAPGTPVQTWLVRQVDETWTSDATQLGGWCRVIVSLQMDPNNP